MHADASASAGAVMIVLYLVWISSTGYSGDFVCLFWRRRALFGVFYFCVFPRYHLRCVLS